MKIERRIVDYSTFAASINKSKRSRLVGLVHEMKLHERVAAHMIQVMPLSGWGEYENPAKDRRRDSGEIRALIKIQDVVVYVVDKIADGKEELRHDYFDDAMIAFVGVDRKQPTPSTITKKDGTPFLGFRGGRKKKELTADEKTQILAMRKQGKNVNIIARELHISNRIISDFVKKK